MKTTNTWLICGVMRICAHLRTFYASRTTNTLSQHSKQSKKACFLSQERNWHIEVTRGNCGISLTKQNLSRHKLRCSGGTLYRSKCPEVSFNSRVDLNYHIAKKHSAAPKIITRIKNAALSFQVFVPWDTSNNAITQEKLPPRARRRICKALRTQEMRKSWRKGSSQVDISWVILNYKNGDIVCSILLSTTLQLRLSTKNWIAFWIN